MIQSISNQLPAGLSQQGARPRLQKEGFKEFPEAPPVRLWPSLGRQFASPLIYILLFAHAVDLALGFVLTLGDLLAEGFDRNPKQLMCAASDYR